MDILFLLMGLLGMALLIAPTEILTDLWNMLWKKDSPYD